MPGFLRFVAQSLFATLFPADCRICDAPLDNISALPVCPVCLESIQPLPGPLCAVCGDRLVPRAQEGQVCIHCDFEHPRYQRAAAFGEYAGALRALIHLLKYEQVRTAARPLGERLARAIRLVLPEGREPWTLVPVPLHKARRRSRGFNQSDLIARAALRSLRDRPIACEPGLLVRTRFTESQTGFTREQRRDNLRGAFAVEKPGPVRDRSILLVDDVLTTGATADECARILLRAGARQVLVATVARAVSLDGVAPAPETCSITEPPVRETASV